MFAPAPDGVEGADDGAANASPDADSVDPDATGVPPVAAGESISPLETVLAGGSRLPHAVASSEPAMTMPTIWSVAFDMKFLNCI